MRRSCSILWLVLLALGPGANAGEVTGRLSIKAPRPPSGKAEAGKYQSKRYKFARSIEYNRLTDFVVYLEGDIPEVPRKHATLVQRDVAFHPHVLPIQKGTEVRWPNEDDIFHNVFSMSPSKSFNLGYYKTEPKTLRFDEAGRVDVFCAIHKDMHAIILILDTPFFQMAQPNDAFSFTDVPAGTYKLHAWHERLPESIVEVTVPAEGTVTQHLSMGFDTLPEF